MPQFDYSENELSRRGRVISKKTTKWCGQSKGMPAVYKINRRGPRTERWGTPNMTGTHWVPGVPRDNHLVAVRQVEPKPKQRGPFEFTEGLKPDEVEIHSLPYQCMAAKTSNRTKREWLDICVQLNVYQKAAVSVNFLVLYPDRGEGRSSDRSR